MPQQSSLRGITSPADARRHALHGAWYDNHFAKLAARRDRHVIKSSHGKYHSVVELVAHQQETEQARHHRITMYTSRRAA
jgi:hypothetical protein